jgi:hypothetical protein
MQQTLSPGIVLSVEEARVVLAILEGRPAKAQVGCGVEQCIHGVTAVGIGSEVAPSCPLHEGRAPRVVGFDYGDGAPGAEARVGIKRRLRRFLMEES